MINYNGEIQQTSPALSAKNRGFLYGDGVFDLVKYVEGKLIFWEEHYLRLMATMRISRMDIPDSFTLEFLESEIQKNYPRQCPFRQACVSTYHDLSQGRGRIYPTEPRGELLHGYRRDYYTFLPKP